MEVTDRLRVLHVLVTPVLVWDDGESLSAGPVLDQLALSETQLVDFAAKLPVELERIAAAALEQRPA